MTPGRDSRDLAIRLVKAFLEHLEWERNLSPSTLRAYLAHQMEVSRGAGHKQ